MNETLPARARSVAELHERTMALFGAAAPPDEPFRPRPTDVIISPFAKCGTTWLQQIFHTLRTGGDEDYDDISRVVPWIETAPVLGIDLNAPQRAEPRGFKSHLSFDEVPKGARYIVSFRDPRDALVSLYKFMEGWFVEPGSIAIDDFARENFMRGDRKRYWRHLLSWWRERNNPDVLLMCYEDMVEEPAAALRHVATFCRLPTDEAALAQALDHSSLDYMLAHKDKFDDRMMREASERLAGLPPGSDSAKVREGRVGGHQRVLGEAVLAELDEIWQADVAPETGYDSYEALRASLVTR